MWKINCGTQKNTAVKWMSISKRITVHERCQDYPFSLNFIHTVKSKLIPRQAEVAQGVPGRLRPRIFSTFGTTRVVGRQPNAPAAFTRGEIPGTHFHQRLSRPRKEPRKKSQVTWLRIDPGTVRLVAQRLNHCTSPGPFMLTVVMVIRKNTPSVTTKNLYYIYQKFAYIIFRPKWAISR
jgi:hypothetical protein